MNVSHSLDRMWTNTGDGGGMLRAVEMKIEQVFNLGDADKKDVPALAQRLHTTGQAGMKEAVEQLNTSTGAGP
jgi:hypothetical protein